jgi:dUTPase
MANKELLNMGVKRSYIEDNIIWIAPHCDVIIPSGIRSKFGPHLALIANNKSGIATKKKLVFGASVIDASYQGEWHLHLINTSDNYQSLEFGQKAIQFIPHLIATDEVEVLDLTPEEFYTEKTSRGDGWQGSTGVK